MVQNGESLNVEGEIVLAEELDSFTDATVTVYLEDVSRMDAPAEVIARQVISKVQHQRGVEQRIAFALEVETINSQGSHSIRAHVSLSGNEQVHAGDYITVQGYPLLASEPHGKISVQVQKVTAPGISGGLN